MESASRQVGLFAAEDAPYLSRELQRNFPEERTGGFMHSVTQVSARDMPPGSEGLPLSNAKIDSKAMAVQIPWQCPLKFVCKHAWRVAVGNESTEGLAEKQREINVQEACYFQIAAIPNSPVEPQEVYSNIEDAQVPQIPLIPVEDDNERTDEEGLRGQARNFENLDPSLYMKEKKSLGLIQEANSFKGGSTGQTAGCIPAAPAAAKPCTGLDSAFLKIADLNVAAAAAAAYGALKAQERGSPIDHNLLVKILTNPVLIENLVGSDKKLSSLMMENGDVTFERNNQPIAVSNNTAGLPGSKLTNLPTSKLNLSYNASGPQETGKSHFWRSPGALSEDTSRQVLGRHGTRLPNQNFRACVNLEPFTVVSNNEAQPRHSMLPGFDAPRHVLPPGFDEAQPRRALPPGSDAPRHAMPLSYDVGRHGPVSSAEGHGMLSSPGFDKERVGLPSGFDVERQSLPPGFDVGRHQLGGQGLRNQMLLASNRPVPPVSLRNDAMPVEVLRPRFNKPCMYFNKPGGCRYGSNCFFVHNSRIERHHAEETRGDFFRLQKKPKIDMTGTR